MKVFLKINSTFIKEMEVPKLTETIEIPTENKSRLLFRLSDENWKFNGALYLFEGEYE